MCCPRVSRGRVYACFTGSMDSAERGGCTAAAAATLAATLEFTPSGSVSVFTFGVGIDGKLREPAASLPASAVTSAGTFATDLASSPLCGIVPSRTMVASSIGSPQWLREQLGPHSQLTDFTAQRGRLALAHWSHSV